MPDAPDPRRRGIPLGAREAVLEVLRSSATPLRRRRILEELEGRGHRISLAGLNRILEWCVRDRLTEEDPGGVRLRTVARRDISAENVPPP